MGSKRVIYMMTAVSRYSIELDIPAPAGELLSEISDPASFAGITRHILLLKTRSSGATGTPEYLPGRLDVVYAYQPCGKSASLALGWMERIDLTQQVVSYRGGTYDGSLTWEATTRLYPTGDWTRLSLSVSALWRAPSGYLGGGSAADIQGLIEHIARDHVEPYFGSYTRGSGMRALKPGLITLYTEEGQLDEVVLTALNHVDVLRIGLVTVEADRTRGAFTVYDGEIKDVWFFGGSEALRGDGAVNKITRLGPLVRLSVYTADADVLGCRLKGRGSTPLLDKSF